MTAKRIAFLFLALCIHLQPSIAFISIHISIFPRRLSLAAKGNDDGRTTRVEITESDFPGAGQPRPDLAPAELPSLLMEALRQNDFPHVDSGLKSMWAFCSDTTRHIFQHNTTDFIESAHETANEFPTSFYGNAFKGQSYSMETELNRVGGGDSESSWIATQVMKTISSDGRMRRWQWEIRKNRRPPNLDCWYVESVGASDRKGEFEPDN